MIKTWTLTIKNLPLTLTLTPPPSWGYCFKCQTEKPIRVISEHPLWIGSTPTFEERKFCWTCSWDNLNELESGDYQIQTKIIQALRKELINYG